MNFEIRCLDCGYTSPYSPSLPSCPRCHSEWREAIYDYEGAKQEWLRSLGRRPFDLWRYRELLPVREPSRLLMLGEGGTPLIRAVNLGMMLGLPNLYIKDERQGPTASFKDRQAAVTIAALKEAGITEMVVASTGNVAISYSAYAARAGIKLWVFVTSLVPATKMREIAIYGSQLIKVTASYDQTKQVAADFARQRGLYLDMGARTIPSVEAMKTIAFEICEQLSWEEGRSSTMLPWRAPDWYIQAVSGGMGPLGIAKAFRELYQMGLIDRMPAIAAIQANGCAPMVQAWKNNAEVATPISSPRTHIETLATGNPGRTYTLLREYMLKFGGLFESVSDAEAFRAMHVLAKMEGISAEPAAAAAFAGLFKMMRQGILRPTDTVVVNCTGHTMPTEEEILGEEWSHDVSLPQDQTANVAPQEGLLAALNRVVPERFPRVAIVDDHDDARRLIRRVLQSQGNFTLFEASNGQDALRLIHRELPDLVILDLMMPEMDGFAVLEHLKSHPETAQIPIIVVTAKELTPDEKARLRGQIQGLMQKGDFLSDELALEVKDLLE